MSSIAALLELLRLKREQLRRLNNCNIQLSQCQSDFYANEYLCVEPQLTLNTWAGTLADEFDQQRDTGILANYKDIETAQFNSTYRVLHDTIRRIELEIQIIEQRIEALREAERRREVEMRK